MYKRTSDVNDKKVYRMVSKKKYVVGETFHPVLGKEVRCILYNAGKSGSKPIAQLIVLKKGDVDNVIEWFYNHFKGESARKLDKRVNKYFVGLSRNDIQKWIYANEKHSKEKPFFSNKAPLKPIISKSVLGRNQIDLVDLSKHPQEMKGKTYRYILSVMDVFSRYIWLRPLERKCSKLVYQKLIKLYREVSLPKKVQSDRGKEFKGKVKHFYLKNGIRMINSAPYKPQSQGKIERSHGTWKRKIRYDLTHEGDCNWLKRLDEYAYQ